MLYTKARKLIKSGKRTKRKEQCITLRIAVEIARSDFFIEVYIANRLLPTSQKSTLHMDSREDGIILFVFTVFRNCCNEVFPFW